MNGTVVWENASFNVTEITPVVISNPLSAGFQGAYVAIGAIGIFGNLISLIVLLGHGPLRRKSSNYFITNQTFIDFLVSIILIPSLLVNADNLKGALACYIWKSRTIFLGLYTASLFNITALTVERYFKIVHPIQHRLWVTKQRILLFAVGVSMSGVLLKMPYIFTGIYVNNEGACVARTFPKVGFSVYNFLVEYGLPLLIIAFCYLQIARSLRKSIFPVSATNPGNATMARARRNSLKTFLLVAVVFVACTTFKQFLLLFNSFTAVPLDAVGATFNVAQILSFSVCCTNPFIYIFHYEEFKVGLRKIIFRMKTQTAVDPQTTGHVMSFDHTVQHA